MKHLYYNPSQNLSLENVDLLLTAQKFPTPFYIYSKGEIQRNCQKVLSISRPLDLFPCYALKANYNPALIDLIYNNGFGADVVSGGELFFARQCGIPPEKIVFAGVGKTEQEISYAITEGIHSLNIESESELKTVATVADRLKQKVIVSIRVNPDIDADTHPYISTGLHSNKFGVERTSALKLFEMAKNFTYTEPDGLHVHIGSQIDHVEPYLETVSFLLQMIEDLATMEINIKYIDLGGGIGIDYHNQLNTDGMPRTFLDVILPGLLEPLRNVNQKILIELGRSIIGTAGLLITKVLYIKETPQKKFIVVDAAMNNLIRPSLYQAYHQILPVILNNKKPDIVDIVGPVCESTDFLAKDRELPPLSEGDYIAVTAAGAYGQSLSSNYNLRPIVSEYLVNDSEIKTIFKGESIEDIFERYRQ